MIRDVVILGATGRIGTALCSYAKREGKSCLSIDRNTCNSWLNEQAAYDTLQSIGIGRGDVLICAAGILDPNANEANIKHVNYTIPLMACNAARSMGVRVVSLGTILETIIPPEAHNPYVSSKSKLQKKASNSWLHLQLHTVFGGRPPAPFMFTGLMLESLKNKTRFSMTPGLQLREYHHVDDEVAAIFELVSHIEEGCLDISHGKSIRLCDLATGVFEYFNQTDLLGIGDMESPFIEAYEPTFRKQENLINCKFRDPLPAIAEWLERYI